MLKLFFSILFCISTGLGYAQQLTHVSFSGGSVFQHFSITTSQQVIIRISAKGELMEYGMERQVPQYNYVSPQLLPYMGRVDYFGPESLPGLPGKVRSIGTTYLTWYHNADRDFQVGKLKTIGTVLLDYYTNFDDKAFAGKLKILGSYSIAYYSSFDNEALAGKVKSIGNTAIQYYSTFDDELIRGRIKSIGNYNWQWYKSTDPRDYRGGLKSGNMRQYINGVNYVIL